VNWAAFVPPQAEPHLRATMKQEAFTFAHSWREFEQLVNASKARIIVDPTADGTTNVAAIIELVRKFPQTPLVTCVTRTPKGLSAAAALAQYGLRASIIEPDLRLNELAENWSAGFLARQILCWAERSLALLPTSLRFVTLDLFERPHRYACGSDLALACRLSLAGLYRYLQPVRLGTPKKLVVVAKMAHAYHHLQNSKRSVSSISELVGFRRPRILGEYSKQIFGVLPSSVRGRPDTQDAIQSLLDWLYKPQVRDTSKLVDQ